MKPEIAVLYHLFYEDTFEKVCDELRPLLGFDTSFLFNICVETPDKDSIVATLQDKFPGCYIICTANKGKDIGGKLALLQLFLQLKMEADYFLLLHDKKSLQALKSGTWKKDLLKIIDPELIPGIIDNFKNSESCGIIATKEYVIPEQVQHGKFTSTNGPIMLDILDKYDLDPGAFEFVAGTMFWVRAKPLMEFFARHCPLSIRKNLENGNVLDNFSGTQTHSWERVLSWIVTSRGYSIKGI